LAPGKCHLGFQEVSLLGHVVFQKGLRVDEAKVEKIKELGPPKNHEEVKNL
jgi:hypothetical protein